MKYSNPIIKGFNPDPSICKAGGDFYLVTSSFEFFPGLPIYHSKDLVNWKMIGHCLTDSDALRLDTAHPSGGLYAPTIRYHKGTFFVVCTNVSDKGHFIIHTDNPEGVWSSPVWVEQGAIDPSLLFLEDKVYFCCNETID